LTVEHVVDGRKQVVAAVGLPAATPVRQRLRGTGEGTGRGEQEGRGGAQRGGGVSGHGHGQEEGGALVSQRRLLCMHMASASQGLCLCWYSSPGMMQAYCRCDGLFLRFMSSPHTP
jgi:hypothetical protein